MKIIFTKWPVLLIMFTIAFSSCKKEKIDVREVPFEELTSSFYVLADGTIEIPIDRMNEVVTTIETNSLILKDTELTDDLEVGTILITQMTFETETFIIRKVESFNRSNGQINIETSDPKLIEALSEYYFNSKFNNIYSFRKESVNLNTIDQGLISSLFDFFKNDPSSPFELTPEFELVGEFSFEAIHPHTAYKYFACDNDATCFLAIDKSDINPANGYYDVVDAFFDNNLSVDETQNGFFTISFDNFGLERVGIKYGTKTSSGGPITFSSNEDQEQIHEKMKNALKQDAEEDKDEALDLKYVTTPITFWGVFSVTIPMCPIMDYKLDAAAYADIAIVFPNRLNFQIGHVNWNSSIPSAIPDVNLTSNGNPVGLEAIFADGSVVGTVGLSGSAEFRFGVGIGAAISMGEANKLGVSLGAMAEATNYYKLSGEMGVIFTDLLNSNNSRNFAPFGEICFDTGIQYDVYLFTDTNLGPGGDFFDKKFTIPKETFGFDNFSFMSLLPNYTPDKGYCNISNFCDSTVAEALNFGLTESDDLKLEFKISNPQAKNEKFNLSIKTGGGDTLNFGPYNYGILNLKDFSLEEMNKILPGLLDGSIEIDIIDIFFKCDANFKASEIGFIVGCDDSPYVNNEFNEGITIENIAGNSVTYYDRIKAEKVCDLYVTKLMSKEDLMEKLVDRPCVNATGYLLDKVLPKEMINSNITYIWIPEEPNGDDLLTIEFEYKQGQGQIKKFGTTTRASKSVLAVTICAN